MASTNVLPAGPEKIRNVVLVGPTGSGKTTLLESLAAFTSAIPRMGRVEDGTTVSDFDDTEKKHGRSMSLTASSLFFDGLKINLLDTPGYVDFVGEVRAGLRAADSALFVIAANEPIDAATALLWDECASVGMPRAVVVTKLDRDGADFDDVVDHCHDLLGEGQGVLPLYLPVHADDGQVAGLISLLTSTIVDYSSGGRLVTAAEPAHMELIDDARAQLLEGIITESEDETLMDRFLDGEDLDIDQIVSDMEKAVARGYFYPVLPFTTTPQGFGAQELLELISTGFPSPLEHPLPMASAPNGDAREPLECDPKGVLCAEIIKTTTDNFVGRLSLARVFSGTLTPDSVVHVSGHFSAGSGHDDHDVDERVGALAAPLGKTSRPIDYGIAGDIVSIAKLNRAETGDTLSAKDNPLLVEPWIMPVPQLPIAISATSNADDDKLSGALARLLAEDPALRLDSNAATSQLVLWCMGEAHAAAILDRLADRYHVSVETEPVRTNSSISE